jgi:HSP20 family molecular chaperone IbpA
MARFLALLGEGTGTTTAEVWAPAMDVWETDDEIVYAFDLPGIPRDSV